MKVLKGIAFFISSTAIVCQGADVELPAGDASASNGSVAIGTNSVAAGYKSAAIGAESYALGTTSTSIGSGTANYPYSVIIGHLAEDINTHPTDSGYAVAIGREARAGRASVAIGTDALANSFSAVAIGELNEVHAKAATAIGFDNSIGTSAYDAVAIGFQNQIDEDRSAMIGHFNRSWHKNSYGLGFNIKNQGYGSVQLGQHPKSYWEQKWIWDGVLFSLGNGWGYPDWSGTPEEQVRSDAIVTLKNGQTLLRNYFWDANNPTAVPTDLSTPKHNGLSHAPTDGSPSHGNALVVEGHTVLKGNASLRGNTTLEGVTVVNGSIMLSAPQGDISMGVFGGQ